MVAETIFEGIALFPPTLKARMEKEAAGGKRQLAYIFAGIWAVISLIIYFTTPKMEMPDKAFIILFFGAFFGAAYLPMSRQEGMGYSFFTKLTVKDLGGAEGKLAIFAFENESQKKEFRLALAGALSRGQMIMDTATHMAEALTDPEKLKSDPNILNYNYKYALEFEETPSGVLATFTESHIISRKRRNAPNMIGNRIVSHVPMSNSILLLDRQTEERLEKLITDTGIVVKISSKAPRAGA